MSRGLSASDRQGRLALLAIFIMVLGGSFSLSRFGASFPSVELRWPALAVCAVAVWAWRVARRDRFTEVVPMGAALPWFLVWLAYLAYTASWSSPQARAGAWLADLASLGVIAVLTHVVASRISSGALSSVYTWFVVAGLVYFLDAMARGPNLSQGRLAAFQGGPNVFVRVVGFGALGALYLAARRQRGWPLLLVPVFVAGAVMSGSRGGMSALAVAVLLVGGPLVRRIPARAVLTLVVAGVVGVFLFGHRLLALIHWDNIYQRIVVETFEQHYTSGRTSIFSTALDIGLHHPLFGAGLDGFYALYGYLHGYPYAHNIVLETFADGGAVGVLLLLVVLVVWTVEIWRCRPLGPEARVAYGAALLIFVASMFSGGYYDSRFLWFCLVLASVFARRDHQARLVEAAGARSEALTAAAA